MVTQAVDERVLVTRDFLAVCGAAGDGKEDAPAVVSSDAGFRSDRHGVRLPKAEITNTRTDTPSSAGNGGRALLAMAAACSSPYQLMGQTSVCTIDKVRLALDRLHGRTASTGAHGRQSDGPSTTSRSSSSLTSVSVKRRRGEDQEEEQDSARSGSGSGMVASACPRCLLYVLISRADPRCPRCHSHVPAPAAAAAKRTKPCFDLNAEFVLG